MSVIRTFMVKASNCVGLAGGPLCVLPHTLGPFSAVVSVRRVHVVKVHHVLGHHGVFAGGRSAAQAEHFEKPKLKLVEEALRPLRALLPRFAELPSANLRDESRSTFQQHLSEQQYHERADHGDHDQSVPVGKQLVSVSALPRNY